MCRTVYLLIFLLLCVSCKGGAPKRYRIEVVKEYPHDVTSYTQGLFFHGGSLYESTGQYGSSTMRKVELSSGKALQRLDFARKYFAEGSVILGDKLYILTWRQYTNIRPMRPSLTKASMQNNINNFSS